MKARSRFLLSVAGLFACLGGAFASSVESALANPSHYERYLAVDDACGWPLMVRLDSGVIAMLIWPNPNHGNNEGAVQCWNSKDEGRHWKRVGVPVPNEPRENRLNVAGGITGDGSLIALVAGTHNVFPASWVRAPTDPIHPFPPGGIRDITPVPAVSRDGGQTWQRFGAIPAAARSRGSGYIPFGRIAPLPDHTLGVMLYDHRPYNGECSFFVSSDNGATWTKRGQLSEGRIHGETTWIQLANGDLYAASRGGGDGHLDGFRSSDNGHTWKFQRELTLGRQHPASLTALPDGRILLTYGVRDPGRWGLDARVGDKDARMWSAPITILDLEGSTDDRSAPDPPRDGGYPSTIVSTDGTLITAYYSRGIPEHNRYFVGVLKWALPKPDGKFNKVEFDSWKDLSRVIDHVSPSEQMARESPLFRLSFDGIRTE